jgi:predicted nucleic acid-binding protein
LLNEDKVVTTELIILELLRGCREERAYRELKEDMESLTCVSLKGPGWSYAYRIGFELRGKGLTIPVVDLLIAVTTIQADAILVHCDHHFEQVAQHTKLRTESLLSVLKTA